VSDELQSQDQRIPALVDEVIRELMPQIIAEVRRRLSEPSPVVSAVTAEPPNVYAEEEEEEPLPTLAELIVARREGGEDALKSRLELSQRGLVRIISRYGLSPGVKVTRWSKERLLTLIEEEVTRRAFRNDVFLKG
jgi:hypothetical protein